MKPGQFGEFELINYITRNLKGNSKSVIAGIGDDCAVIKKSSDEDLLLTCDALVEDVHFDRKYFAPEQIGEKVIAVNASDIAAMGGKPKFCLVSLVIPQKIEHTYIKRVYDGIGSACQKYGIQVVGGNVSKGDQLVIDVFMTGEAAHESLILRKGAQAGDRVLVTGFLGVAAGGLQILKNPKLKHAEENLIASQLVPKPRIMEARILSGLNTVTSMMDISDGLSGDLMHMCDASKTGVEIYESNLPVSPELKGFAKKNNIKVIDLVLNGGEDYELHFTARPDDVDKIVKAVKQRTGTQVSVIGEILPAKEGRWIRLKNGERKKLESRGWDHIKNDKK